MKKKRQRFESAIGPPLLEALSRAQTLLEAALQSLLPKKEEGVLAEAMRAASLAGGKRLRPFLLMESAALFGLSYQKSAHAAAALEMVHIYSLIHDDLPSMDDGVLRHGAPALHRVYGEGMALLAGDALLTLAFEILARAQTCPDSKIRAEMCLALARASGVEGMAGGQALDLQSPSDGGEIHRMRQMKTATLFACASSLGAMLAGAPEKKRRALYDFGMHFGTAYQIADDVSEGEGRDADKKSQRPSPPAARFFKDSEKPRADMAAHCEKALASLEIFAENAAHLRRLCLCDVLLKA